MSEITYCTRVTEDTKEPCRLPTGHYCQCVFVGERMPPHLAEVFYIERRLVRERERERISDKLGELIEKAITP